jgi:hypothetical protein
MYRHELEAELSSASEPEPLSLNEKWRQMEEAVRKIATNTIGYTRKQAGKDWFDEECEMVNEEKNTCRVNAIHRRTRAAKEIYRQARLKERNLFKEKSRQLDEEAFIEIERHRSIQDSLKYYKRLNDVKRPFEAQVAMCRAKNGELLTTAAGADSIAAELLKNGGPLLVDALEEVIQLAWTSETLPVQSSVQKRR